MVFGRPGVGEVGARGRALLVGRKSASDVPPVFIYWTAVLYCILNHIIFISKKNLLEV